MCHSERLEMGYHTDPYGGLLFAIGSGDDFVCFDFAEERDNEGDPIVWLGSTLNSETGCFIQDFEAEFAVPLYKAAEEALRLTEAALEWVIENDVEFDIKGWNQDPYFFYRIVLSLANGGDVVRIRPCHCGRYKRPPKWDKRGRIHNLCRQCATEPMSM